ncbi:MAG: hypothetical protein ACRCYU_08255 [Nocardioides sp.]
MTEFPEHQPTAPTRGSVLTACGINYDQIVDHMVAPRPGRWPRVVLILSVCRSGGTALMKCFATSGYETHYQPIKSLLRRLSEGLDTPGDLRSSAPTIVLKETLGPYLDEECRLDPVEVLRRLGLPDEKIAVVLCLRDPAQVAASWRAWFRDRPGLPDAQPLGLLVAARTLRSIRNNLPDAPLSVSMEQLAGEGRGVAAARLFSRLGLCLGTGGLRWGQHAPFGAPGSNIVKTQEPDRFRVPGILDEVKHGNEFRYVPRDIAATSDWINDQDLAELRRIYDELS